MVKRRPTTLAGIGFLVLVAVLGTICSSCVLSVDARRSRRKTKPPDHPLADGWGNNFDWVAFNQSMLRARATRKPMMVLIHKSWCGACRRIKDAFKKHNEISRLAKNFIMVNCGDNDEPEGVAYRPDGPYYPRVIFADPNAVPDPEIVNEDGNPKFKYYYPDVDDLVNSMRRAAIKLSRFKPEL